MGSRTGEGMPSMLLALSTLLGLDVQRDPAPAILLFVLMGVILVVLVSFARARDERRQARGDLSGWRSRERPRS